MSLTVNEHRPNDDSELAGRALVSVRRALAEHHGEDGPVSLIVEGEKAPLAVPRQAIDLLVKILANIAAGQSVSIVPQHAELTTQQAAEILNVSRPFLVKLLDEGKIEFKRVGTHRRIRADSLLQYKHDDDARGRTEVAELIQLGQEMGLAR